MVTPGCLFRRGGEVLLALGGGVEGGGGGGGVVGRIGVYIYGARGGGTSSSLPLSTAVDEVDMMFVMVRFLFWSYTSTNCLKKFVPSPSVQYLE